MNPVAMTAMLVASCVLFAWSMARRLALLASLAPARERRGDQLVTRLRRMFDLAIAQAKLGRRPLAGVAHRLVFAGFCVLLLRSLVLWGRGLTPAFDTLLLGPRGVDAPIGQAYTFLKDACVLGVLIGVAIFAYLRLIRRERRLTLNAEGLLVLAIIGLMMLADLTYDGASLALLPAVRDACAAASPGFCAHGVQLVAPLGEPRALEWRAFPDPGGSLVATLLSGVSPSALTHIAELGFWAHSGLVLVFLNLLPYSKHFHVITAFPNVFFARLGPPGRLAPITDTAAQIASALDHALSLPVPEDAPLGCHRIEHLDWKAGLDLFACTECGRCTESCPATRTGKPLDPRGVTVALRRHLLAAAPDLRRGVRRRPPSLAELLSEGTPHAVPPSGARREPDPPVPLVPGVVSAEAVWACTTCRACDEECPLDIRTSEKLVELRRHLVMVRGEHLPGELMRPFEGMQLNGNPWGRSRLDRLAWTQGIEVPTVSEQPDAEVLFWVGCAGAYDPDARRATRATVRLLARAGVRFAVLGEEETCTGDAARRAGNELLFAELAEQNVATLSRHFARGHLTRIVTGCPHCQNTLAHEYPDFGGRFSVSHVTELVEELVAGGRLRPERALRGRVAYHDPCYLGRYAGIYDAPRRLIRGIVGLELVEAAQARERATCCGAGGAHMWIDEKTGERINVARARELERTGAPEVATACPFCTSMLSDGLKALGRDPPVAAVSVVELVARACGLPVD